MTMKLRIYRFGRQEHKRRFRGYTVDDVFFRNILHMFEDIRLELALGFSLFNIIVFSMEPMVTFKRKFCINDN